MMAKDPYQFAAPLYDYLMGPLNKPLYRVRTRLAPPQPGMKVLDVGCGTGSDLELYHQGGCEISGVDLSPAMVKVARKKFGGDTDLRVCDASQMPYEDESFDLVLTSFTLHEMSPELMAAVLLEMIRVVKQDGKLLLCDFAPRPFDIPMGWLYRYGNLMLEVIAGREHLMNGINFVKRGGLKELIKPYPLGIVRSKVIGAGTIDFLLLSKDDQGGNKE
jgi:ubiquinone/menaquinone biosynthesis C-methylase UbiE